MHGRRRPVVRLKRKRLHMQWYKAVGPTTTTTTATTQQQSELVVVSVCLSCVLIRSGSVWNSSC